MEKININGEEVFLKKSELFGWGVIHPTKKEDGTPHWKNILIGGSWFKFILMVVAVIVIVGAMKEYSTAVTVANDCLNKVNVGWLLYP